MAGTLPRVMVLKINSDVVYVNGSNEVVWGAESVFNTVAKIEVEPAAGDNKNYFHLRFSHTNKYWAAGKDGWLVADSNKPEEDTTKPSCTLFEHAGIGSFALIHVQTGSYLQISEEGPPRFYVGFTPGYSQIVLTSVDWDTLVKMPNHVAFKGENGNYLQGIWAEGHPYLQFAAEDPNQETTGYQVTLMPDGYIRIYSEHFTKFWRRSPNWIWADSTDTSAGDIDTLFWPVKIDETTIALRNAGNNNFCKGLDADGKTRCLNAAVSTITKEARIQVEELVLDRKIYNVRYRMDDARIFDETPFVAGTTSAINYSDVEGSVAVELGYEDTRSYSFSRSVSMTAGVKVSIEADVLGIVKGGIEISFEVTGAFEWGHEESTTKTVKATGSVPVPPKSIAVVNYVGTVGTCNVPFDYSQQDKSSSDGGVVEIEQTDGIFNGVNYYNFSFEIEEIQPLPS